MIEITVEKNLIALEDLLLGVGTIEQTRGGVTGDVTKINGALFPYDADFTMAEKIDALQAAIDSIPAVVDINGEFLTGFLNESAVDLVGYTQRLWVKTIAADHNQLYYDDVMMLEWDPQNGNLITSFTNDYIAADAVVTAAFIAADVVVTNAYIAADAVVTAAFIAADAVVTTAYQAADTAITAAYGAADTAIMNELLHRASVIQQPDQTASAPGTKTVDYADGAWAKITVSSDFTLAFIMPAGEVCSMVLELVNAGSYTITWPAGTQFAGGTQPALSAAGSDHLVVYQNGSDVKTVALFNKDVQT